MFSHTRIQDTTTRTYIHVTNIVFEHADERWPWIWIIAFVIVRYRIHIFVAYFGKDDFKLKLHTNACNCLIERFCICNINALYLKVNVFMLSNCYKWFSKLSNDFWYLHLILNIQSNMNNGPRRIQVSKEFVCTFRRMNLGNCSCTKTLLISCSEKKNFGINI